MDIHKYVEQILLQQQFPLKSRGHHTLAYTHSQKHKQFKMKFI